MAMPHMWLTPVTAASPWTLGAERTAVELCEEWDTFRRKLHAVHPRLLPFFKVRLMTAAEYDQDIACGGGHGDVELAIVQPGPIVFDAAAWTLSHCGEAFLCRLLEPAAALGLLEAGENKGGGAWESDAERRWAGEIIRQLRHGFPLILLG